MVARISRQLKSRPRSWFLLTAVQPDAEVAQLNLNKVGQSNRTVGKHFLLNRLIARECGVMIASECKGYKYPFRPYFVIDLCAGDGRPSFESQTSSPEIIQKHIRSLKKFGVEFIPPLFVERNKASFDCLNKKIGIGDAVNFDATSNDFLGLVEKRVSGHQEFTTFIHNDPNLVSDWAITLSLLSLLHPSAFTTYSTLGCNVGGLKRLPLESRIKWRERVESLLSFIPSHHSAILATLDGDCAQWAYLITVPERWIEKTTTEVQKAFSKTPFETTIAVKSKNGIPDLDFYHQLDHLTLTRKELDELQHKNHEEEAV